MGFTNPETQVSEGPGGETVKTQMPAGQQFMRGLGDYFKERAPVMSGVVDAVAPQDSGMIEMNAKPKTGGGLAMLMKLMGGV